VLEETARLDVLRFRHALVRDAIYWNTNILHRRRWHAQIARALAQQPDVDPVAVAHHFVQADDEQAADWLIEAAQQAARAFALQAAITGYERALAILQQHPERRGDQAGVLCALAEAHRFTDSRRALAYISQAVGLSEQIDDPGVAVLTRWVHARVRGFDDQTVLTDLVAAAAAYRELPETERLRIAKSPLGYVVSDATLAQELANYGQFRAALEHGELFLEAHHAPAHRAQYIEFGNAHFGLGIACAALGEPERARAGFERSRAYFRESGSFQMVSNSYYWELNTVAQTYIPDQPAERHKLQQAEARANLSSEFIQTRTGERQDSTSETLILDGDWEACRRSASARLSIPASRVPSARKLAEIEWLQGNAERAWSHVRMALPGGPEEPPGRRFFLHRQELQCIAAQMALQSGDGELARRWIEAFERWMQWSGTLIGKATAHLLWSGYHAGLGDLDAALRQARQSLELAMTPAQPLARLRALRALGELTARAEKPADAVRLLDEALELAIACAAPYELALVQVAKAQVLKQQPDAPDEVRALLAGARSTAERLGARPLLDRIDELERESAPTSAVTVTLPGGLSPREVEVLQLLARGMTDAEIADALFISPRTVHGHLNSIYGKLDVSSRTAAVARAFSEGIVTV
jgi:DNA-binding CsgD family transcriptional regulator